MTESHAFNNPAGRLHWHLSAFADIARKDGHLSCIDAWSGVFSLRSDAPEFVQRIGTTGALFEKTRQQLSLLGRDSLARGLETIRPSILRPFDVSSGAFTSQGSAVKSVAPSDLSMIEFASNVLSDNSPEGDLPSDSDSASLRDTLEELKQAVRDDETIPYAVRRSILLRLTDIERSLDDIKLGGPDGVKSAVERLGAVLVATTPRTEPSKTKKRLFAFVAGVWVLFSHGTEVDENVTAWQHVLTQSTSVVAELLPGQDAEPSSDIIDPAGQIDSTPEAD